MAASMADVLAEHELSEPRGYAFIVCACGTEFGNEGTGREHVAAALAAAGFGSVALARADALNEAADALGSRYVHISGTPDWQATAASWLHDRAAAVRSLRDEGDAPSDHASDYGTPVHHKGAREDCLVCPPLADEGDTAAGGECDVRPCARCGVRSVVGTPGGMDICGPCGYEEGRDDALHDVLTALHEREQFTAAEHVRAALATTEAP